MTTPTPAFFADALIGWYHRHKRPLPWRETADPYAIWLSEVILQQTRVSQGLPYYLRFINAYPTVHALADAPEDEVLRYWQGLGYYSRARNMHQTAQELAYRRNGQFPENYMGLLKLRGVGSYTAAAIASFAYKEPVAVLDGNVFRVLARVFGLSDNISSPVGRKAFQLLADTLIPTDQPDTYNQAIMEFGAIQCTPVAPDCLFCPLQPQCHAFQHGLFSALPHKEKAKPVRPRYFHYLVFQHQDALYLRKRTGKDIWQGLYDFYLVETDQKVLKEEELAEKLAQIGISPAEAPVSWPTAEFRRLLSHQKITAKFYLIRLNARLKQEVMAATGLAPFSAAEGENLPKPVLISNFLKSHQK
ncbi:A/G-specific adenine glycosylase [soil metagenome]